MWHDMIREVGHHPTKEKWAGGVAWSNLDQNSGSFMQGFLPCRSPQVMDQLLISPACLWSRNSSDPEKFSLYLKDFILALFREKWTSTPATARKQTPSFHTATQAEDQHLLSVRDPSHHTSAVSPNAPQYSGWCQDDPGTGRQRQPIKNRSDSGLTTASSSAATVSSKTNRKLISHKNQQCTTEKMLITVL